MDEIICPQCKASNKGTARFCSECGVSLLPKTPQVDDSNVDQFGLGSGNLLQERYLIVQELGRGGFGAVYQAWDTRLNKAVAVKENLETTPESQRQFTREALVLANLSHPNLPRVTDHFTLPGQAHYLVMDFVEGEDLETTVKRQGKVPTEQALSWILQVVDALEYLHEQEPPVFHRDIKPANIRINSKGNAMLVDFGLVKVSSPSLKTTIGARAISPGYAPPEQYGLGRTDARTDIYGLAATLYRLITGSVPLESVSRMSGDMLQPANQVNPEVTKGLSQLIEIGMALDPIQRYQSAGEFNAVLQEVLAGIRGVDTGKLIPTADQGYPTQTPLYQGVPAYPISSPSQMKEIPKTEVVKAESEEEDRKKVLISGAPFMGDLAIGKTSLGSAQATGGAVPSPLQGIPGGGATPPPTIGGISKGGATAVHPKPVKAFPRWLLFSCAGGVATFTLLVIIISVIALIGGKDTTENKPAEIEKTEVVQIQQPSTQAPQDIINVQPSPTYQGESLSTAVIMPIVTAQIAVGAVGQPPSSDSEVIVPTTDPLLTIRQAVISFLSSLGISATPERIYGPENGNIIHDPTNDQLDGKCIGVKVKNFLLQTLFSAPYSGSSNVWDFGTMFRTYENGDFRIVLHHYKGWEYIHHTIKPENFLTLEAGEIPGLGTNKGDTNLLQLVVMNEIGWLYVNDSKVAKLDLSSNQNSGAACIAIGFYNNTEQSGEKTPYSDFTVWELR